MLGIFSVLAPCMYSCLAFLVLVESYPICTHIHCVTSPYVRMLGIFSVTAPYMYACTLCDRTLYVRILGIFSVLARYMYACLAFLV